MTRYLARRLLLAVPVLFGVITLVFSLIHLIPGDPAVAMLGEGASGTEVAALRHRLNLDLPLDRQYGLYLASLAHADLGASLRTGVPVARTISERFPATIELALASMLVALVVALPLGILAAVRQGSMTDTASMGFALLGISIPNFWLGPMLAIVFAVQLGWFPVSGRGGIDHLALPAVTLGVALAAILARMTRSSLLEELGEPYVLAARARGLARRAAVMRHAFPNSLIPIVTIVGLQFGAVLTGTIITETIFSWPGLGRLLIQSINFRDYPVVQGCILVIAVVYTLANLLTDLAYAALDPRIRY